MKVFQTWSLFFSQSYVLQLDRNCENPSPMPIRSKIGWINWFTSTRHPWRKFESNIVLLVKHVDITELSTLNTFIFYQISRTHIYLGLFKKHVDTIYMSNLDTLYYYQMLWR